MKFPTFIDCYMIVIKGNEASEYYANYCKRSWENFGINVNVFDAIVPDDLQSLNKIRFTKYSSGTKYVSKNIEAEITDTEKSCFYSHYMLWEKCIKDNSPILVLEHDAYLEHPNKLWFDMNYGMIFYDNGATGAYIIFPWFAKLLLDYIKTHRISSGPYSSIEDCSIFYNARDALVNKKHKKFEAASNQVMSDKYGNTIEHFCNLNPELFNPEAFHKFKKI